jgi:hypothetical protein
VIDLLKLEIVRRARKGNLQAREPFFIRGKFDLSSGALTLSSVPVRVGAREGNGDQSMSDLSVALRRGAVTSIVWDHSALGWQVDWEVRRSQWLTVFVGVGGVHRFDVVVELVQSRPERVAGILASILGGEDKQASNAPAAFRG